MEEGDWVVCWERPRDGYPRWEWFGARDDAERHIASWQQSYPFNTYSLVRVEKVFKATEPVPLPRAVTS